MSSPTTVTLHERIIGTWSLVSMSATSTADPLNIIYPQGLNPSGLLIYSPDGYMSCQQQDPNTPPYSGSNGIQDGTVDELARAAKSYFAYSGKYFVDEQTQTIWHGMTVSLIPNWIGQVQKRQVMLEDADGGEVILDLKPGGPVMMNGEERIATIRWKKMKRHDVTQHPSD